MLWKFRQGSFPLRVGEIRGTKGIEIGDRFRSFKVRRKTMMGMGLGGGGEGFGGRGEGGLG